MPAVVTRDQCSLGRSHEPVSAQRPNFNGSIAQFGVWGRELQESELLRMWNSPPANLAPASFLLTWPAEPGLTLTEAASFQLRAPVSFAASVSLSITATNAVATPTLSITTTTAQLITVTASAAPLSLVFALTGGEVTRFRVPITITVPRRQSTHGETHARARRTSVAHRTHSRRVALNFAASIVLLDDVAAAVSVFQL
jgi:hypothetical protein